VLEVFVNQTIEGAGPAANVFNLTLGQPAGAIS
jgi:hypothetical protein